MTSNTWVIVADSSRARVLQLAKKGRELQEIKTLVHPESRSHERELTTDRPGRSFDRMGPGRHAMSETVSPKQHEAWKLCKELAGEIETARSRSEFDRLVLVAAPPFLGALRKTLSDTTLRLTTHEVGKNMAEMPARDILRRLVEGGVVTT